MGWIYLNVDPAHQALVRSGLPEALTVGKRFSILKDNFQPGAGHLVEFTIS